MPADAPHHAQTTGSRPRRWARRTSLLLPGLLLAVTLSGCDVGSLGSEGRYTETGDVSKAAAAEQGAGSGVETTASASSASPTRTNAARSADGSSASSASEGSTTPTATVAAPSSAATERASATAADPTTTPSATRTAAPAAVSTPVAAAAAAPAAAGASRGPVVKVVDGDTLDVRLASGVERVRVIGLDTPEIGECGFREASAGLRNLVAGTTVTRERDPTQDNRDRYGRLVRHVRMAGGDSAAVRMIRQGLAPEYLYDEPYLNRAAHLAAERAAKAERLGIWGRSGCTAPAPAPAPAPTPTPAPAPATTAPPARLVDTPPAPAEPGGGACRIKGNIASSGEKIFHSPGQRHYTQTKISPAKGERWFCSAAEAIKAGWRAAKV